MTAPRIDLTGQRFGRLVVGGHSERRSGRVMWACLCDCGEKMVAQQNNLRSGNTTSCGCAHRRHGHSIPGNHSPTYNSWQNMISRVDGQRGAETTKNYSGRGIGICGRWRAFDLFLKDMGARPDGTTLDRIDNDRGYECGVCQTCIDAGRKMNCRWATRKDQQRNRRTNVLLTLNGDTACFTEWCERIGIRGTSLTKRIRAWGVERALSTPKKGVA